MKNHHLLTVYELFANNVSEFTFHELRKPESAYKKLCSLSKHRENNTNLLQPISKNYHRKQYHENNFTQQGIKKLTPVILKTFLRCFSYLFIQNGYEVFNLIFDFCNSFGFRERFSEHLLDGEKSLQVAVQA